MLLRRLGLADLNGRSPCADGLYADEMLAGRWYFNPDPMRSRERATS